MDERDLARAHERFAEALRGVADDQWELATPCSEWTVRALVGHVVAGEAMVPTLLEGTPAADAIGDYDWSDPGPDPLAAFESAAKGSETAFGAPGALGRTIHHVIGDLPASQYLAMRTSDVAVHTWDLARATGQDETIDPALVSAMWAQLEPMAAMLPSIGVFGEGASGTLGEDAPLQDRLLDLTGRRP